MKYDRSDNLLVANLILFPSSNRLLAKYEGLREIIGTVKAIERSDP